MNPSIPKIPPPIFFLIALIVMILLNSFVPIGHWLYDPWRYLGTIVIVIGFSLSLGSGIYFRKLGTNPRPGTQSNVLVAKGPFRYTRNLAGASLTAEPRAKGRFVPIMLSVFGLTSPNHVNKTSTQNYATKA